MKLSVFLILKRGNSKRGRSSSTMYIIKIIALEKKENMKNNANNFDKRLQGGAPEGKTRQRNRSHCK